MKKIALSLSFVASLAGLATAENRATPAPAPAVASPVAATHAEIQKTFGFVPDFVKSMPAMLVTNWWNSVTSFQMNPSTKLDAKTKELIGIAVAAATPCEYCIYFHTEAARLGARSRHRGRSSCCSRTCTPPTSRRSTFSRSSRVSCVVHRCSSSVRTAMSKRA